MRRQYTAGELARLAGVTSRTIRYYDERGLLKPVAYTEGNYRLYDEGSLLCMQQIRMLKYAGFSLEEIERIVHENEAWDLKNILKQQKLLMIEKKKQLEQVIDILNHTMEECENQDFSIENFSGMMQLITMDCGYNKRFFAYEKHSDKQNIWYNWLLEHMGLQEGMKILDMGAGYGMAWIRGFAQLPENMHITLVDKQQKGLHYFERFLNENNMCIPKGVKFEMMQADLEEMNWEKNSYDLVIANYLWPFINEPESLLAKVSKALRENGRMISTISAVGRLEEIENMLKEFDSQFRMGKLIQKRIAEQKRLEGQFCKQFSRVETEYFDNVLIFSETEEMLDYMSGLEAELGEYICANRLELKKYFSGKQRLEIKSRTPLYCCS